MDMKSGSNLEKVLKAGHFAFTGELGPPRGTGAEEVRKKASFLKGNVDAVNITDNQTAVVRMASWAACIILIQEGLEPNFQMVCRDRNRLAMQSDILGALPMESGTCCACQGITRSLATIHWPRASLILIPCN